VIVCALPGRTDIDVRDWRNRTLEPSIGMPVSGPYRRNPAFGQASVTYWSGVPLGINDYDAARDEIVRRIDDLLPTLTAD
jgi:hypothetical protein